MEIHAHGASVGVPYRQPPHAEKIHVLGKHACFAGEPNRRMAPLELLVPQRGFLQSSRVPHKETPGGTGRNVMSLEYILNDSEQGRQCSLPAVAPRQNVPGHDGPDSAPCFGTDIVQMHNAQRLPSLLNHFPYSLALPVERDSHGAGLLGCGEATPGYNRTALLPGEGSCGAKPRGDAKLNSGPSLMASSFACGSDSRFTTVGSFKQCVEPFSLPPPNADRSLDSHANNLPSLPKPSSKPAPGVLVSSSASGFDSSEGPSAPFVGTRKRTDHVIRRRWSPREDEILKQAVAENGARDWNRLARQYLPRRTAKQLRARWVYYLQEPDRVPAEFSQEQDQMIFKLAAERVQPIDWCLIARNIGGQHNSQEVKFRFRKLVRISEKGGVTVQPCVYA